MNAGFSSMAGRAFHVKSHQLDENPELRDTLPWTDLVHLIGNDKADEYADTGADLHPVMHSDLLAQDHQAYRVAKKVLQFVGKAFPLWPAFRDRGGRHRTAISTTDASLEATTLHEEQDDSRESLDTTISAAATSSEAATLCEEQDMVDLDPDVYLDKNKGTCMVVHRWQSLSAACWVCSACGARDNHNGKIMPPPGVCPGRTLVQRAFGEQGSLGHRIRQFLPLDESPHPIMYGCERCGGTGSQKAKLLGTQCFGRMTPSTQRAYRRLVKNGQHPHSRWGSGIFYRAGGELLQG